MYFNGHFHYDTTIKLNGNLFSNEINSYFTEHFKQCIPKLHITFLGRKYDFSYVTSML